MFGLRCSAGAGRTDVNLEYDWHAGRRESLNETHEHIAETQRSLTQVN